MEYSIDTNATASEVFQDITTNFASSPFPFSSNCGLLVVGSVCDLDGGIFGVQPVEVVGKGENSFTFESLPGHGEGAGNLITFAFEDSPSGALTLTIDARGPYDTFVTRYVPVASWFNFNVVTPGIWGGYNVPFDGFAERLQQTYG